MKKAADMAKKRVVGDPFTKGTQQGPQVKMDKINVMGIGYKRIGLYISDRSGNVRQSPKFNRKWKERRS